MLFFPFSLSLSFFFPPTRARCIFSTPPSLHAGCVRAMVGHLKFRVFPPSVLLQPFIADRLRSITRLRKGNRTVLLQYVALNEVVAAAESHYDPHVVDFLSLWCCFLLVGGWFTFVHLTHRISDDRIVPLSVQIMKSCSSALWPLEDGSDVTVGNDNDY